MLDRLRKRKADEQEIKKRKDAISRERLQAAFGNQRGLRRVGDSVGGGRSSTEMSRYKPVKVDRLPNLIDEQLH